MGTLYAAVGRAGGCTQQGAAIRQQVCLSLVASAKWSMASEPLLVRIITFSDASGTQEANAARAEKSEQQAEGFRKALRTAQMEREAACDLAAARVGPEEARALQAALEVRDLGKWQVRVAWEGVCCGLWPCDGGVEREGLARHLEKLAGW